jgi:hypothetical protein
VPAGTCYISTCDASGTSCSNNAEWCDKGFCVTQSCNVSSDCAIEDQVNTNWCVDGVCATCEINSAVSPETSTCESRYWCNNSSNGQCVEGACSTDSDCGSVAEYCTNEYACEQIPCDYNTDCETLLCVKGSCTICEGASDTAQDTCNTSDPTTYCASNGKCFVEECVGASSTPSQVENCTDLTKTCDTGKCETTNCSAGNMGACRS